jgi:hypothetical protein
LRTLNAADRRKEVPLATFVFGDALLTTVEFGCLFLAVSGPASAGGPR